MFVDQAKIIVKAGDGGNGIVSFRREKYVPDGGPDGGNGGRGGHVILKVDSGMRTLMDFRYKRKYQAENGMHGAKKNCYGKDGANLIVKVPPGTLVKDVKTGVVIADLTENDSDFIVARGGKGGRGNSEFKTSTRRAPTFAEAGFKGVERELILELKMIADVGLVGYPNVGKSTLLARVTKAKPKIANYHFTTLKPNLGVVEVIKGQSFVMADIPGLIAGAAQGVGLGHDFLRHIERTRLILHVVDVSGIEGRDPIEDYRVISEELKQYNQKLAERPTVVVANKSDVISDSKLFDAFKAFIKAENLPFFIISAATGEGVDQLMRFVTEQLANLPIEPLVESITLEDLEMLEEKRNPYQIDITKQGDVYELVGEGIARLVYSTNFDDYDSLRRFEGYLRRRGIFDRLREMGIEEGQTVRIFDFEFEFYD